MAIFFKVNDGQIDYCEQKFIIYGNGPHTRVIYGYVHDSVKLSGFIVDDHMVESQPHIGDYSVTPLSLALNEFPPKEYTVLVALGFRDFNNLRKEKTNLLRKLGYRIISFIDDSVRLPKNYSVEENCIVIDHAAINDGVVIKEGVFVSSGAMIGHDSILEGYSWIGSGVALAGGVVVGESSILGLNCSVKQNTHLGHHTLVFPNTFLNFDTDPYAVIASEAGKSLPYDSRRIMKFAYINNRK